MVLGIGLACLVGLVNYRHAGIHINNMSYEYGLNVLCVSNEYPVSNSYANAVLS